MGRNNQVWDIPFMKQGIFTPGNFPFYHAVSEKV